MAEYINILQEMLDKYERKPDVYGKLIYYVETEHK